MNKFLTYRAIENYQGFTCQKYMGKVGENLIVAENGK